MSTYPGPITDDDTFHIIDDALATLAERRGAWLGDDIVMIHLLASLIAHAERCLPQAVTDARANGHAWHDLAVLLATSPHKAQLRFDPDSPIADDRWPIPTPD